MIIRTVVLTSLLLASASPILSAQERTSDPRHRNDCRLAAQVLETGHPAPHFEWAIETIARCRDTGGEVLSVLWARPPVDSVALERIFFASYTLRDARITEAVITAARNPASPRMVRLTAIRVLAGHAEPGFLLSTADLDLENDSTRVVLGRVSHVVVVEGEQLIGPGTLERIINTLADLRADASDPQVAQAAAFVYRQVCRPLRCRDGR